MTCFLINSSILQAHLSDSVYVTDKETNKFNKGSLPCARNELIEKEDIYKKLQMLSHYNMI